MSEISLVPAADVILAFFEGVAWSSVPTLLLSSLLCKKMLKSSISLSLCVKFQTEENI